MDIGYFAFVFFIVMCGFGFAFLSLSSNYDEPMANSPMEALKLSYHMAIGDFDASEFDTFTWFCFFAATIIEIIIMMNLLIAIVGDTFQRVQNHVIVYIYRARCEIIDDYYKINLKGETKDLKHVFDVHH